MSRRKMSYSEIFDKYKLVLNLSHLNKIITDPAIHQIFYDGYQKLKLTGEKEEEFAKRFFAQYSNYIDLDAYVFYTYQALNDEARGIHLPEVKRNCEQFLRNSRFVDYSYRPTEDGQDVEIVRTSARELIGLNMDYREERLLDRWKGLTSDITPVSFFSYTSNSELRKYCNDEDLIIYLIRLNYLNIITHSQPLTIEEKMAFMKGNDDRLEELVRKVAKTFDASSEEITCFYERIPEYIEKFPSAFDFDKIFLISAHKAYEYLEGTNLTEEQNRKYTVLLQQSLSAIKARGTTVEDIISILDPSGRKDISYKELQEARSNITPDGYYVSKHEKKAMLDQLSVEGSRLVTFMGMDPDRIRTLNLTDDDYEQYLEEGVLAFLAISKLANKTLVMKKFRSMEIPELDFGLLARADFFNKKEVLDYCSRLDKISNELLAALDDKGLLDPKTKVEYLLSGKLDFEQIDNLRDEKKEEIKNYLSAKELIDLYMHKNEGEEQEEHYNKYVRLFRNLKLKGLERDEKLLVDEQIIEALGDLLDDDILKDLYKSHLIQFRTLKDWSGNNVISQMMERTEIRPEDVKEMCVDGDYDALIEVLSNPNISKSRKMAIFRTSFANIEYDELDEDARAELLTAREICLKLINLKDEKVSRRGPDTDSGTKRTGKGKRFNEYTSDPQLRWDLIDLMGEYSYEMLDQGMAIFKFPDYKGGTIVLEKMYRKDKPEYGRATKIINMSIEEFEKIKPSLIVNDDIPAFQVDTHPALKGKVRNINHTTAWGKQFADYFEYDVGETRTQEEIDRINRKIQSILNSRELR